MWQNHHLFLLYFFLYQHQSSTFMCRSFSKIKVIKTISSGQLKESHSREDVQVREQDFTSVFEPSSDWCLHPSSWRSVIQATSIQICKFFLLWISFVLFHLTEKKPNEHLKVTLGPWEICLVLIILVLVGFLCPISVSCCCRRLSFGFLVDIAFFLTGFSARQVNHHSDA